MNHKRFIKSLNNCVLVVVDHSGRLLENTNKNVMCLAVSSLHQCWQQKVILRKSGSLYHNFDVHVADSSIRPRIWQNNFIRTNMPIAYIAEMAWQLKPQKSSECCIVSKVNSWHCSVRGHSRYGSQWSRDHPLTWPKWIFFDK